MENLIESDYGFFIDIDSYSNNKNEREKYFKKLKYKINQMSVIDEEQMEEDIEEINYYHEKPIKKTISSIVLHYSTATLCTVSLFYFVFYLF
jgi:endonuclease III